MNLKDPEKEFFDDFEHKVTDKIKKYGDRSNFPKLEDYGIERMELEDYLFDKQAIMDMGGTPRHKMTVGGIVTLIPIIILSAMPDSAYVWQDLDVRLGDCHWFDADPLFLCGSESNHPNEIEQA